MKQKIRENPMGTIALLLQLVLSAALMVLIVITVAPALLEI